jgi:hypothetical protein
MKTRYLRPAHLGRVGGRLWSLWEGPHSLCLAVSYDTVYLRIRHTVPYPAEYDPAQGFFNWASPSGDAAREALLDLAPRIVHESLAGKRVLAAVCGGYSVG